MSQDASRTSSGASRGSLMVVFLTVFIDLLGFGMVLPLLPVYTKEFGENLSPQTVGWLVGLIMASFSAMQFLFAPLWGRLSDRIGRRPVLMIGLAGSVLFYTIFGIASVLHSVFWLFVSRIGAGIAGATISIAQAYIADTTTLAGRTKGMALIGAAFGLGFTFGPLFGFLAMLGNPESPGPLPGYAAAGLSAFALLLAYFKLPESLPERDTVSRSEPGLATMRFVFSTPSLALLLLTSFVCVFSFANFESTLSLLLHEERGNFGYTYPQMLLTFAFIGLVLTLVQGGIVRRLAQHVNDAYLAGSGAVIEVIGFGLLVAAHAAGSTPFLLFTLAVVVTGFAFMTPSINALISRRTDPAKQGRVLGLVQAANALARIAGPVVGAKLFLNAGSTWPYYLAAILMALGLVMVLVAAKSGQDYVAEVAS